MGPRAVRNALEFALFVAVMGVVRVLPERAALGLGAALGSFAGGVLRIRRRAVLEHLALAFPEKDEGWRHRVARACYRHVGREAVAIFRLSRLPPEELRARTRMVGFERFQEEMAKGRGVILMTGHLGNWELGAAGFTTRGVPFDAVAKPMENSLFGRALAEARRRVGMGVIDVRDAPRGVLRSLRQGRAVAILADQNTPTGDLFVPFFGRPASAARGPAMFALRSGAPMMLAVPLRDPGPEATYTVTVEPIEFEPTGDRDTDVVRLTEAHTRALEAAIRRAPEQYFWLHRRWKRRPPVEEGTQEPGSVHPV